MSEEKAPAVQERWIFGEENDAVRTIIDRQRRVTIVIKRSSLLYGDDDVDVEAAVSDLVRAANGTVPPVDQSIEIRRIKDGIRGFAAEVESRTNRYFCLGTPLGAAYCAALKVGLEKL